MCLRIKKPSTSVILRDIVDRLRAFALEAGRLGSILSRVKPKILKLVSAVTLAKRSAIKCSAEDEINREQKHVGEFLTKFSPGPKGP